jgi:hypothetical protein
MKTDYLVVTLTDPSSKKRLHRTVHSLVALSFIGDRPQGYLINHIDGNKENNCVWNLEYCTPSENATHAYSNGLISFNTGENHRLSKLTRENVLKIREDLDQGVLCHQLAKEYKVTWATIYNIKTRKNWKYI